MVIHFPAAGGPLRGSASDTVDHIARMSLIIILILSIISLEEFINLTIFHGPFDLTLLALALFCGVPIISMEVTVPTSVFFVVLSMNVVES